MPSQLMKSIGMTPSTASASSITSPASSPLTILTRTSLAAYTTVSFSISWNLPPAPTGSSKQTTPPFAIDVRNMGHRLVVTTIASLLNAINVERAASIFRTLSLRFLQLSLNARLGLTGNDLPPPGTTHG
jgi:hypothetical protein